MIFFPARAQLGNSSRWTKLSARNSRTAILVLILTIFSLSGCSVTGNNEPGSKPLLHSLFQEESIRGGDVVTDVEDFAKPKYLFLRGELAFAEEEFDEALEFYREASSLEKDPAPLLRKRLAQIYVKKGMLKEALEEVRRAKGSETEDVELLELEAGVLSSLKKTMEAITAYKKLIALQGDQLDEDSYILLASLYAESNDLTKAKETLNELLKRAPSSIFGYYYLARIAEMSGDFKGAEDLYRKALSMSPEAEMIKIDLARCLGLQKRQDEAVTMCQDVIRENPQNVAARQLLGQLLLGANRVDEALKELETLRGMESDPSDTRLKIALIKLERRDLAGAEQELSLLVATDPKNISARYYLAVTYAGQGKVDEAVQQIKHISPGERFFVESRVLAAYLLRQDKRNQEAAELLLEATNVAQKDTKLLGLLSNLQREAGQKEESLATLKKLLVLEPNNDLHYFTVGVLYDEMKQPEEATKAMSKSIEINPKNSHALNYLAYAYSERGENLPEAEKLVKRALVIEPTNGYYIDTLGWIYFKQKRYADAERELRRAVEYVGNDAVILEHLAQILAARGSRVAALETAKKALVTAPESDDKAVVTRLEKLIQTLETQ